MTFQWCPLRCHLPDPCRASCLRATWDIQSQLRVGAIDAIRISSARTYDSDGCTTPQLRHVVVEAATQVFLDSRSTSGGNIVFFQMGSPLGDGGDTSKDELLRFPLYVRLVRGVKTFCVILLPFLHCLLPIQVRVTFVMLWNLLGVLMMQPRRSSKIAFSSAVKRETTMSSFLVMTCPGLFPILLSPFLEGFWTGFNNVLKSRSWRDSVSAWHLCRSEPSPWISALRSAHNA